MSDTTDPAVRTALFTEAAKRWLQQQQNISRDLKTGRNQGVKVQLQFVQNLGLQSNFDEDTDSEEENLLNDENDRCLDLHSHLSEPAKWLPTKSAQASSDEYVLQKDPIDLTECEQTFHPSTGTFATQLRGRHESSRNVRQGSAGSHSFPRSLDDILYASRNEQHRTPVGPSEYPPSFESQLRCSS